ncbi:hypothetical protein ACWEVD_07735 [Nocardia thailandica]|uniref:hypothetical protein n=1 Tax=Nocardia thailandica TaxID=257275 RepID=UPI0002D6B4C2|nr:hypothetical protein [Nocardia thailandica]
MNDIDIELPTVTSAQDTGLVLDIDGVRLRNPLALAGEDSYACVCDSSGRSYRLPAELEAWATEILDAHYALIAAGLPAVFPCRVEFGIRDAAVFAKVLDSDWYPGLQAPVP